MTLRSRFTARLGFGDPARPRGRAWWELQRGPPRNRSGAGPCPLIVGNAWKPATQLDGRSKLATTIERSADSGGLFLGNDEHLRTMEAQVANRKCTIDRVAQPCCGSLCNHVTNSGKAPPLPAWLADRLWRVRHTTL
ncbi:MAG TPA: hypothetical protein VMB73_12210 [Acetobacteraceae bacterium]|nr:hypothetical protein [Acetobacteraceae bacterium]